MQALAAGRAQPRAAGAAMASWFRRTRRLGSKDRRRVAEVAYGVIRHESLLLRVVGLAPGAVDDAALVSAWARLAAGERFPELSSEGPRADYATALSLPEEIAGEWLDLLGPDQAAALAWAFAGRAPVYLRTNAMWGSPLAAVALLAEDGVAAIEAPGPWALQLSGRADLQATSAGRQGAVEIQDLSSQAFVAAVDQAHPLRGVQVLDLCAGAGGKSLAMAAVGARVRAWDVRPRALDSLRQRARRAGHDIAIGRPGDDYEVVVVDAPCSGSGRLKREPALRWGLDPNRHLSTQTDLLADAARRVRPGGLLAYATCSLLARENDQPSPAGFTLVDAAVRWPHQQPGDGFAWRLWRRES